MWMLATDAASKSINGEEKRAENVCSLDNSPLTGKAGGDTQNNNPCWKLEGVTTHL